MDSDIYDSTKIYPYVYLLVHKDSGEFYIGSRWSKCQKYPSHIDIKKYQTSCKWIKKKKFHEFNAYILAEFFTETKYDDVYDFEQWLINEHWGNPLLLNKTNNYGKLKFRTDYENQTEKESLKHRKNISKSVKAHWDSKTEEEREEHRKIVSYHAKLMWENRSEEEILEFSRKLKECWDSKTEEEREEHRNKVANKSKMPCRINGKLYDSRNEAAQDLNLKVGVIRKRLFSNEYPNYIDESGKGVRKTKKIYYKGVVYRSIRQASEKESINRSLIKEYAEDENIKDIYFID